MSEKEEASLRGGDAKNLKSLLERLEILPTLERSIITQLKKYPSESLHRDKLNLMLCLLDQFERVIDQAISDGMIADDLLEKQSLFNRRGM